MENNMKYNIKRKIIVTLAVLFALLLLFYVKDGMERMSYTAKYLMSGIRYDGDISNAQIGQARKTAFEIFEGLNLRGLYSSQTVGDAIISSIEADSIILQEQVPETIKATEQENTNAFVVAIAVLIFCYLGFAVLDSAFKMEMMSFGTAVYLLFCIGLTYRVVFSSFGGYKGVFEIIAALAGIFIAAAIWRTCRHNLNRGLYAALVAVILFLLMLHAFTPVVRGARGWFYVFGISVQLSEFIKVFIVVLGACSYRNRTRSLVFSVITILSAATMVFIRDLGAAVVFMAIFFVMNLLLYDSPKTTCLYILAGVALFALAVFFSGHARARVSLWLNGVMSASPTGNGYQQRNFILNTLAAGWSGLGFEQLEYFQCIDSADSDGALAGVAAIHGIGLFLITIICYIVIMWSGVFYDSSVKAGNHLILFQLSTILFTQTVLNYAGSLNLLPFTGITAPLISAGGSSLISTGLLLGLAAGALYEKRIRIKTR